MSNRNKRASLTRNDRAPLTRNDRASLTRNDRASLARNDRASLARDERGALAVEYVVVTMAGLMIAAAVAGLGVVLVEFFGRSLTVLYSEYP